jgi:hypothetical protein
MGETFARLLRQNPPADNAVAIVDASGDHRTACERMRRAKAVE